MTRSDPIGPTYYVPLGIAEKAADAAFYLAGVLSVVVLFVDKNAEPALYNVTQATFALSVIGLFSMGIVIKVHFAARAHAKRVSDFVSNAFRVPLVPLHSQGYYNTPEGDAYVRIGAAVLENSLFTKSIVGRMLLFERFRGASYLFMWLWALYYRSSNLELLSIVAQVLFSEQLISRWVRMEWLRLRTEGLYDDLYALFQVVTNTSSKEFRARVIDALIRYETSKAQAGLSLSSRVFRKMNADLSAAWVAASRQLGLVLPTAVDTRSVS